MILELHTTLRRLLYQYGQISPHEVDITFDAPTHEYIETLTQPTINIFLFGMQENIDLRQNNFQTTQQNGRMERRPAPRHFDLCFMVSALASAVEDEHQLLWRILLTLVQYTRFPSDVLSEEQRAVEPPLIARIAQDEEGQRLSEIWSACSVPPHPALLYVITLPVELNLVIAAPLVLTRKTRYTRIDDEDKKKM